MFSDPRHNIEQLGLSDGAVVADLGTGTGYYATEAARAVAPMGRVYAIDVQRDLVERLKKEVQRSHLTHIETMVGDLERLGGSKLRESSVDVVIASNILFMIENKKAFLQEAYRITKKDGRLLLVDWAASFSQMGPHPGHVVYKDEARKLAESVGFVYSREIHAGTHHYGIIFHKR